MAINIQTSERCPFCEEDGIFYHCEVYEKASKCKWFRAKYDDAPELTDEQLAEAHLFENGKLILRGKKTGTE